MVHTVVLQVKQGEVGQVVDKRDRHFDDLVVSKVKSLQRGKLLAAELPHVGQSVHVHVKLGQPRDVLEHSWDRCQLVSVQTEE